MCSEKGRNMCGQPGGVGRGQLGQELGWEDVRRPAECEAGPCSQWSRCWALRRTGLEVRMGLTVREESWGTVWMMCWGRW